MGEFDFIIKSTVVLLLIILSTQITGYVFRRFNQPFVVGEMVAGILLGPSFLGFLFPELQMSIFSKDVHILLSFLSNIGLALYMFLIGLEFNFRDFNKATLKFSLFTATAGFITPLILTIMFSPILFKYLSNTDNFLLFNLFLIGALALTAFPMLARILQERDLTYTQLGSISLLSASIDDVIVWILLAVINMFSTANGLSFIKTLIGSIIFLIVNFYIIKPILKRLVNDSKILLNERLLITIILCLLLITIAYTDYIQIYSIFGSFILGLIIPRNTKLVKIINSNLMYVTNILFLPVFFSNSGLKTDLTNVIKMEYIIPFIIIIFIAFLGKYGGILLALKSIGFSWRESSAIGGLMNARGLILLIFINIANQHNIINDEAFSIFVITAIITTGLATPIFNLSYNKISKV